MIGKLINNITELLLEHLSDRIEKPKGKIGTDEGTPIRAYEGKLTVVKGGNDDLIRGKEPLLSVSREFRQEFYVEVYDNDQAMAGELAALSLSIVLTERDLLLEKFNVTEKAGYRAGKFTSEINVDRFEFLEEVPESTEKGFKYLLKFEAGGMMSFGKEVDEPGVIERIEVVNRGE